MNKTSLPNKSSQPIDLKKYYDFAKIKSKEKDLPATGKLGKKALNTLEQEKLFKRQEGGQQGEAEMLRKLQKRYKELQQKYRELLEKVKERGLEHERTRQQLEQQKKQQERDKNQIERLRCILGFIKRRSVSIQVEEEMLSSSNGLKASRSNKFDQSTVDDIRLKHSGQKFHSREKTSPGRSTKRLTIQSVSEPGEDLLSGFFKKGPVSPIAKYSNSRYEKREKEDSEYSKMGKKLSNSPYAKYRYVPSGNLH